MTLRIGLFGCGKQAPKHLSGLMASPDVEVVVFDRDVALAKKLAGEMNVSYVEKEGDILCDDTITAIDICTPVDSHLGLILKATNAGMDFFCEKPLCRSHEEAHEIYDAVQAAGVFGMVGFNYRFSPAMQEAQHILAGTPETGISPVLGRITGAVFRLGGRGGHQLWKHQKHAGGGAINEMIVHSIDLFLGLIGPIADVEVLDKRLIRPERPIAGEIHAVDAEDFLVVKLTSTNGISAICQADLITPSFIHYVDIAGENGNFFGSIQPEMPNFVYCEHSAGGYEKGRTELDFGHRNFFEAQMASFIISVRTRVPPVNGTVEDSVNILDALDRMRVA